MIFAVLKFNLLMASNTFVLNLLVFEIITYNSSQLNYCYYYYCNFQLFVQECLSTQHAVSLPSLRYHTYDKFNMPSKNNSHSPLRLLICVS